MNCKMAVACVQVALARGVYNERVCKLCTDGVVVMGEYGLSISLMAAGYTFDTLMYKYGGVDWRDEKNWKCNDQVRAAPLVCQCRSEN